MFANSLKIESDSSFTEHVQGVTIESYRLYKNKVVISGQIDISDEYLRNFKTIARFSFSNSSLQKEEYLVPNNFVFVDSEFLIDNIKISQRILTNKKFTFEIPADIDLTNFSIYASFITSIDDTNIVNYYEKTISLVWSSELIRAEVISDKTYVPLLMDETYIVNSIDYSPNEEKTSASELFYTLDNNNNFYATVFFNLANLFTTKIKFSNLLKIPAFFDFFRQKYLLEAKAHLLNGSYKTKLDISQEQNISLRGTTQSIALSMNCSPIDTQKFDGGFIGVDFTYQESSVLYVQDVIIPFVTQIERSLSAGIISNSIIDVLLYYKVLKEANSQQDSFQQLLNFKDANEQIIINDEDVQVLKRYASYVKSVFIKNISDISADNLFDTKVSILLEQPVYLKNNNASINFFELNSINSNFPTYYVNNFTNSFSNEIRRFYSSTNISVDNTDLNFNLLNVSFAPSKVFLSNKQVLQNTINFTNFDSSEISAEDLDLSSFEFSKVCSYFSFEKDLGRVLGYDFQNILDRDLFFSGVSVIETKQNDISPSTFNVVKRDNSISYNQFPSGFRDEVCIDSTVRTPTSNVTQQINSREVPDNLFNNIVTNNTFVESNTYSGSYSNVSISNNLPIQVIYPTDQFKNRTNTLFQNAEPVVSNNKLFSIFFMNFKIIAKVEYLDVLTDGMFSMWKPFTISNASLLAGSKILCRLSFYRNSDCNITETTFDAFSIYNRYFYLEAR
jgi:hypothetical protein